MRAGPRVTRCSNPDPNPNPNPNLNPDPNPNPNPDPNPNPNQVTRVRELLTPKPLRELRIKADYLHHQTIDGAAGIKICANNLEGVVAGSACMVPYDDPYP